MSVPVLRIISSKALRVRRTLDFNEVRWASVLQLLVKRHRLDFRAADLTLKNFFRRVITPFHPRWFIDPELTTSENILVSAICELHGSDSITLVRELDYLKGPLTLSYRLELELEPDFRSGEQSDARAVATPKITLTLLKKSFVFRSSLSVLTANLVLVLGLAVSYAAMLGALLYVASVVSIFVQEPSATAIAGTRSFAIGSALLTGLVLISAVAGKVIRKAIRLAGLLVRQSKAVGRASEYE